VDLVGPSFVEAVDRLTKLAGVSCPPDAGEPFFADAQVLFVKAYRHPWKDATSVQADRSQFAG